ncbi:MAG: hypothetical protein GY768_04265 [Planctomycetaceae bacterium]|nr:hypothetical protein [Planctomycetaceae bacterium]
MMPEIPPTQQPTEKKTESFTDSVWFWLYLFGTAALIALYLSSPKYGRRQSQIERQFSARQSAGQAVSGVDGPVEPSTVDNMIISLDPLFLIAGILLVVGWTGLWWQRFRHRKQAQAQSLERAEGAATKPVRTTESSKSRKK